MILAQLTQGDLGSAKVAFMWGHTAVQMECGQMRPYHQKGDDNLKLVLTLLGRDSWSRPVYQGSDGNLYVDVDPCADRQPKICTKYNNAFDGEPDTHVVAEITFTPYRDTWS